MSWNLEVRGGAVWWLAGIGLVLATGLSLLVCYWEELRADRESLSTTVRNVGVVIGGVIAILLAVWRSTVGEKQTETAQRGLLNERYQKGAEMLGSEVLSVRLGGIYALARLACEHPGDYHTQIMSLLCAFVRHPPETKKEDQDTSKVSADILVVMKAVRERSEAQIKTEKKEKYRLALSQTNLFKVYLFEADLSDAYLIETNLKRAILSHADLTGANLSNADMRGCIGLTQEQIDQAVAQEGVPPNLEGVIDAKTSDPLVWRVRSGS